MGLGVATVIASATKLPKPERLAIAVECCYQNTGIATSAVLTIFTGEDLQRALRVPLIYGFVEALFIGIYLIIFWKLGWTKAPKDEKLCCTVITTSYEIHEDEELQEKKECLVTKVDSGEESVENEGDEHPMNDEQPAEEYTLLLP
jgi:hypothetical protein